MAAVAAWALNQISNALTSVFKMVRNAAAIFALKAVSRFAPTYTRRGAGKRRAIPTRGSGHSRNCRTGECSRRTADFPTGLFDLMEPGFLTDHLLDRQRGGVS